MTTYLGKSCSFCLPRVPFVNCRQFMYLVISLLVLRAGYGIWLYQFLIIAYLLLSASAHRLLFDLKFCKSASTHGIFFGLNFCTSASAQGDLKFRSSAAASAYRKVCDLKLWSNTASAQGKHVLGSDAVPLHTINLVQLDVSLFHFYTRALTLSPAVPLSHKVYSVTWSSAVSLPHKEYTMSRSSAVLLLHTEQSVTWSSAILHNILWLELRSSASARKDVIWNFAILLLHESITFLWKIHSHSTTHPFLNFRAVLHEWWTLWRTEKQRNRDAPGKSQRLAARGISWWHIMFILAQFATELPGRPRATTARTGHFITLTHLRQRFWTVTVSVRRYGPSANTIHYRLRKK